MKTFLHLAAVGAVCFAASQAEAFNPDALRILNNVDGAYVSAINDASTMVVANLGLGFANHAFSYDGATLTDLGTLGGSGSYAYGVNDYGVIVGKSQISQGVSRAFAYTGGRMIDLGTLGGDYSAAFNINDAGTIVGESLTSDGQSHAFSFTGGQMTDLGTLPFSTTSAAYGINSACTIVGVSNERAFSYSNGVMTALDGSIIYSLRSGANAINDSGTIVGWSKSAVSFNVHAMSYSNGVMADLGDLGQGWEAGLCESYATAISNDGTIVGYSTTSTQYDPEVHAFIYKNGVMTDLGPYLDPDTSSQAFAVDNHDNVFGGGAKDGYLALFLFRGE